MPGASGAAGAAARLEGASDAWLNAVREAAKPVRMPVKRKGKTRDQRNGDKRNKDKRNRDKRNRDEPGREEPKAVKIDCGSGNAQLLKTLLSRSSLRRRFVTDFLRPDMVTFEPDGGVWLLKRAGMNLKVLAEDMLRSMTFAATLSSGRRSCAWPFKGSRKAVGRGLTSCVLP